MKKMKNLLFMAFFASLFMVSCSSDDDNEIITDDDPEPEAAYENGMFVLNEGNGDPATASVSFIDEDGTVENNIFRTVNPSADEMGSYLQDMFFDETRAFILSGSANSMTVVDRNTFEFLGTVASNFENPRYGVVVDGKAYVTNYADYATGDDDFMTVIDLTSFSSVKIPLNNWSEKVLSENGKIYIANGYYGSGNSISVYNPTNDTVEATIDLGAGNSPNSFEEKDGVLYVLTSNYGTPGKIIKIDVASNQITSTVDIPSEIELPSNLVLENDTIYFTADTSVFSLGINASSVSTTPVLTYESNSQYGAMYGFDVEDGSIYISDGGDFASDSEAYQYSLSGDLLNTFQVGVGPNGFFDND